MGTENIDYAAVVADLEARCARTDAAIAGLEKLRAARSGIVAAITALRRVIAGESEQPGAAGASKAATAKK